MHIKYLIYIYSIISYIHKCSLKLPLFLLIIVNLTEKGLPRWPSGKESTCSTGDIGSIPGSGRYPGGGNGNLLQFFCLEVSMDRGTWWATAHGVTKSRRRLSDWAHTRGLEHSCKGDDGVNVVRTTLTPRSPKDSGKYPFAPCPWDAESSASLHNGA